MDRVALLESAWFADGKARGERLGYDSGRLDGENHGRPEGWSVGFELGYLRGLAVGVLSQKRSIATSTAETLLVAIETALSLVPEPNGGESESDYSRFEAAVEVARGRGRLLQAKLAKNVLDGSSAIAAKTERLEEGLEY